MWQLTETDGSASEVGAGEIEVDWAVPTRGLETSHLEVNWAVLAHSLRLARPQSDVQGQFGPLSGSASSNSALPTLPFHLLVIHDIIHSIWVHRYVKSNWEAGGSD